MTFVISLYRITPDGVCVRDHCVEVDVTVDVCVKIVELRSIFVDTKAFDAASVLVSDGFAPVSDGATVGESDVSAGLVVGDSVAFAAEADWSVIAATIAFGEVVTE